MLSVQGYNKVRGWAEGITLQPFSYWFHHSHIPNWSWKKLPGKNLHLVYLAWESWREEGKWTFRKSLMFFHLTLPAFHTMEPFLSSFHFVFFFSSFRGLDPRLLRCTSLPPTEQSGPWSLSLGGTFPWGGGISLPTPCALCLVRWWTSETWRLFVCLLLISEAELLLPLGFSTPAAIVDIFSPFSPALPPLASFPHQARTYQQESH